MIGGNEVPIITMEPFHYRDGSFVSKRDVQDITLTVFGYPRGILLADVTVSNKNAYLSQVTHSYGLFQRLTNFLDEVIKRFVDDVHTEKIFSTINIERIVSRLNLDYAVTAILTTLA